MRRQLFGFASAVLLLAVAACGGSDLVGAWTGRDQTGTQITYSFLEDGTGYRIVDAETRQTFRYLVTAGYPNLIEIELSSGEGAEVRRGLVEVVSETEIRLELAEAGMPAPTQLSPSALTLRRPPAR
jgi:hypothetical protein